MQVYDFGSIPSELKARPQWVVWRAILRDGKITKPPFQSGDPNREADTTDPTTWGTYEEAVACLNANPSVVSGIGYVFSRDDPYVGADLDDREKVAQEYRGLRYNFENMLAEVCTYTEYSPSGLGLHAIFRATIPVSGRHQKRIGAEFYAYNRFFTFTGRIISPSHGEIREAQQFIDALGLSDYAVDDVGNTDSAGRRLDLPDYEVVRAAYSYNTAFGPRFEGRSGCDAGEWSHTFVAVVGVLDQITGDVSQLERIVLSSGMVTACAPSASGESRPAKARRTLHATIARVRGGNNAHNVFVEHGRQVWQAMELKRAERARAAADELRRAEEQVRGLSRDAQSVLSAFPELTAEHKVLTKPPGTAGEFVEATMAASHAPYLKFAIPAALSALAGIVGRGYKLPGGGGINMNFILAAPSATGKTQTMAAWERFIQAALAGMPATPSGPPKSRIVNSSTSSIQGIMRDFEDVPSCAWFVEECKSQISAMTSGNTPVEAALRDSYNRLYDCAQHGFQFSPPRSVAGRNAGIVPVENLSVSTFWTTTTSKLDIVTEDALDGFLSRVVVVRHTGEAGQIQRVVRPLPDHLLLILRERLTAAQMLDDTYRVAPQNAAGMLTPVDFAPVEELLWSLRTRCFALNNAALRGQLPPPYTALSRLPLTAARCAAVLAVVNNPYAPVVTEGLLRWSFGYLLQASVALLSDMDSGEIGAMARDDVAAAVRCYKKLLSESRGTAGVPRNLLYQKLKHFAAFSQSPLGRGRAVTIVLEHMVREGMLEEQVALAPTGPTGKHLGGRPCKLLVPITEHAVWQA